MDHDNCPMTLKRFWTLWVERALYQISIIIIIINAHSDQKQPDSFGKLF